MNKVSSFEVYATDDSLLFNEPEPDCACPSSVIPVLSETLTRSTMLQRYAQQCYIPLSDIYGVVYVPSVSRVVVLNQAALALLERFQNPQPINNLDTDEYRVVAQLYTFGLLNRPGTAHPIPGASDTLVAWLHITNMCNLHCSYCYIQQDTATMSLETAHTAINAIFQAADRYAYRQVHLKYAGGEPSLRLSLVEQIHTYANEQATRSGVALHGTLLSNGINLSNDMLQRIGDMGLRLMISLDGLEAFHDAQRPYHGGQGSFAQVAATIERARAADLDLTISITLTGVNVDGLPDLLAWLLKRDLNFSLNFYRKNERAHSCTHNSRLDLDAQHLRQALRRAYGVIEQHPPRYSLLHSLLDRTDLSVSHRYACPVGLDYLVIDPYGSVVSCQMDLQQPVTTIWDDDPLAAIRHGQAGVQNLPVEEKDFCQQCEWRYWCAGGCSLVTHQATGSYATASPHCALYQTLFPEIIRLEGLRLLYWSHRS